MDYMTELAAIANKNGGIIETKTAAQHGISKAMLYKLCKAEKIHRIVKGQYVLPEDMQDELLSISRRSGKIIFSHETALFFHDLTDREPLAYSITVKTGYNPTRLKSEGVQVFTIKAELYEVGLSTAQTPFGHDVPVYDMERTICDVLRSRSHIEMQTFQDALKAYARRKDKDLRTLVRYAKLFRVEKILRQYLEVLL